MSKNKIFGYGVGRMEEPTMKAGLKKTEQVTAMKAMWLSNEGCDTVSVYNPIEIVKLFTVGYTYLYRRNNLRKEKT